MKDVKALTTRFRYGVNLLHFGRHANLADLLRGARLAEELGFDVLFVRDHVAYRPRPLERADPDYIDSFVALAAVAAVTTRIGLGMAVLNPHRHPIHAAQLLGNLTRLAGTERVFPMWGLGGDRELTAVEIIGDRFAVLKEQIEIMRELFTGKRVTHEGPKYRFADVDIRPIPDGGYLPMWYGGSSVAGVRRAVEVFDGWSSGHLPGRDYRRLRKKMLAFCAEAGRDPLPSSISTLVSPGRTVEEGTRKLDLERVLVDLANPRKRFTLPASGKFETLMDIDGAALAGPADEIIAGVRRLQESGVDLVIFDLRQRADDFDETLRFMGQEVLPALRRSDTPSATTPRTGP